MRTDMADFCTACLIVRCSFRNGQVMRRPGCPAQSRPGATAD